MSPLLPVAFEGLRGWYSPAGGSRGVLMCSPLDHEELGSRRGWHELALMLAAAGLPALRFDYPGAGDSTGEEPDCASLTELLAAVKSAAVWLRRNAGIDELVLVGLRFGATLAALAARDIAGLHSLVLMAPVVSGRAYAREMTMLSRMLLETQGITSTDEPAGNGFRVGGFLMSRSRLAEFAAVNLAATPPPLARTLILAPPNLDLTSLAKSWSAAGGDVTLENFPGYGSLVCDPIKSQVPLADFQKLIDRLTPGVVSGRSAAVKDGPAILAGRGWREEPAAFGPENRLLGIHCVPERPGDGNPVLFVTGGYNYHAGWGRLTVELARHLARNGIPSLRFDIDGVGESGVGTRRPEDILYTGAPIPDVTAAMEWMALRHDTPLILAGSCSGAYLVYHTARKEKRIAGIICVNLYCFEWDRALTLEQAMRRVHAPAQYLRRAASRQSWKRVLAGEVNLPLALWRIALGFGAKLIHRLRALAGEASGISTTRHNLHQLLAEGKRLGFIYSAEDTGLAMLREHLGADLASQRFPALTLDIIEKTDHDMSNRAARHALAETILRLARAGLTPSARSAIRLTRPASEKLTIGRARKAKG